MSLTPERLEAMIVAHRKVLRDLMVSLPRDRLDDLRQRLTRGETVQDGAEDPGVLPQEAFSFEADGQHDGDEHDSDAALLRCEVMGFRAEQPPKPIPRDEGGRHQDEGRLPERGQILHRGMAEGVILIRRARGIEDRGQSAQRHQQVE